MRARRIVAAALGAALVLASPMTALAHEVALTYSGPPDQVTGNLSFSVTAESPLGVGSLLGLESFWVSMSGPDNAGGPWGQSYDGFSGPAEDTVAVPVNTTKLRNGAYTVAATAQYQGSLHEPTSKTMATLRLNNAPAAPKSVQAAYSENPESVRISWARNTEPDITKYLVLRAEGEAEAQIGTVAGNPAAPSFTDASLTKGATYVYKVVVVRPSPVSGEIKATSASNEVAIPLPPPPPSPRPEPGTAGQTSGSTEPATALAPGGRQPLVLGNPNPSPLSVPSSGPYQIQAPSRAKGFAPTLPYGQPIPQLTEQAPEAAPEEAAVTTVATPATTSNPVVDRARFLAAGLLLLVIAIHVGRAGRVVLAGARTSDPEPDAGSGRGRISPMRHRSSVA